MNKSCHIWMVHVTYEWVIWHMNQSCSTWHLAKTPWVMSVVSYESCLWCLMSHVFGVLWVMYHLAKTPKGALMSILFPSAATHSLHTLQHTATHCNTLQHTATHCNICNTPQRTATLCNTLQYTATHRNTPQHSATICNNMQHSATLCNTLQHSATHCNKLQHTLDVSSWNQSGACAVVYVCVRDTCACVHCVFVHISVHVHVYVYTVYLLGV